VGRLDRFRRLERARPDRKEGGSAAVLDRFREPSEESDPADKDAAGRGPRSCAACGAENNAGVARCFNCDADLETPEMRAHQRHERRRAEREAEEQRKAAEALAQREFERIRRETEARRAPVREPIPGTTDLPPFELGSASPLVWLLRSLRVIEDPWYRFGARLLVISAFVGLLVFSLSGPQRYPFLILAVLLLGGGMGGRRGRWNRWDRWDRWR